MTTPHVRFILPLFALLLASVAFSASHELSPSESQSGHGYKGYGHHGMSKGMGMGMDGGMGMLPRIGEKLGLSEAQKTDLAALLEMYRPRFKEIAARGKEDRAALLAMAPDDSDYAELSARVSQEAGQAAAEVVTLLAELQGTVYALLTPEQQAEYLELRASQKERMQNRRDRYKQGNHHKPGQHNGPPPESSTDES
jgi:Spy/CpxP family protein refolding chaperone